MKSGPIAIIVTLFAGVALAQNGAPSGRGSVSGDPAASSASPKADAPTTGTSRSNPSGSGTSSSGGKDDNGDAGRDKMPESNRAVRPESEQHHPNDK